MMQYDSNNSDSATAILEASSGDTTKQQVTQAAIFCTDEYEAFGNTARERPIWLIPIAGRPMLDRVLGHLADFGIKQVDIFVSCHALETYQYVAAGETTTDQEKETVKVSESGPFAQGIGLRWGMEIKIIDVRNTNEGLHRLVHRRLDSPIFIGTATAIPPLAESFFDVESSPSIGDNESRSTSCPIKSVCVDHPILFRDTQVHSKTVWMIMCPERFVGKHCHCLTKLAASMEVDNEVEVIEQEWPLSVDSVHSMLHTQRLLLEEKVQGQPIEASRVEAGLWISRNVDLHPSVQLIPPVYVGADCRIDSGVVLGPNVVIENHCIVEERTTMANSMVLPDTFVGRELTLDSAMAGSCFMQPVDALEPIEGIDQFILGPNSRVLPRFLTSRLFARIIGVSVLVVLLIPIVMLWCLGRLCGVRRPIRVIESVYLPACGPPNLWRTFRYREFRLLSRGGIGARFFTAVLRLFRARRWPGLINVASGKVAWVGLRPQSIRKLASLPNDRRALCMRSKVGLIRLSELDAVRHGHASGDQEYASDIYYVATASPWFDLCLFWRSIWAPWFRLSRKLQGRYKAQ